MSFSHLLILGIIAVIVIPPDKLPEVAKQVARFLGEMRRMTSGVFDDLKEQVVLKPEDMLKKKNSIHNPEATAPVVEVKPEPTSEEIKKSEEEYLKHIQGDQAAANETEKKPHE